MRPHQLVEPGWTIDFLQGANSSQPPSPGPRDFTTTTIVADCQELFWQKRVEMEDEDFCWLRSCQTGLVMLEAVVGVAARGVIADRSWWERE